MNNFSIPQLLLLVNWGKCLPSPNFALSSAGSLVVAAAVGGGYGLLGRVVYPNEGIFPLHYAIWFSVSYQIKESYTYLDRRYKNFLGVKSYLQDLEKVPEDQLDLKDQIRYHTWKIIQLKNRIFEKIDEIFCRLFSIRPAEQINKANVREASFLEMCRYRIWKVFKMTIIDTVSFAIAYRMTGWIGFSLPKQTNVPILLLIRSLIRDIILIPGIYTYVKLCNQIVDEVGRYDVKASQKREKWLMRLLPKL